jgi:adenine-specific DNA-methyltransferase
MKANIDAGLVVFGPDETTIPTLKRYLEDYVTQVPTPSFYKDRRAATVHLAKVLGEPRFPNPKEVSTVATWVRTVTLKDAVVLDFFGGSGSTVEAVMQLNADGDSARQCILVTNNEVSERDAKRLTKEGIRPGEDDWESRGVHEFVTRPRIMTVTEGTRPDHSKFSDGLEENVEFFTLTYESAMRVFSNREFTKIAPFLWLRAGSKGRRIEDISKGWDVADAYGVIANLDMSEPFIDAVEAHDGLTHAFIVTDDDRLFEAMVRQLPDHVEPVRLYSSYLRNFEIEAGRATR